ncbi:MAG: HD domain-containing protein [Defluviitaleaceae bacterium]|nr:HD domain-containing protein [Defluviitaleaceae bacterium]
MDSQMSSNVYTQEVRVKDDNSLIGRVIAVDVLAPSGEVLCREQTTLTQDLVERFISRGVRKVTIITDVKPVAKAAPATPVAPAPAPAVVAQPKVEVPSVIEEAIFQSFSEERAEKVEVIKDQLHGIISGAKPDMELLHGLTSDIVGKLRRRSDVLSYIRHLEETDDIVFSHSINVSMLCNLFGHWLKMNDEEIVILTAAGALHDIGMAALPKSILKKTGKLTEQEHATMREHTSIGYDILKEQDLPEDVKLAALMHHERIDGTGYPQRLTADKINRYGSIVAICDIYDAMISKRHYRDALSPFTVIQTFEQKMYDSLDTAYLIVFLKNIAHTFLHSHVLLSDGRTGQVIFTNKAHLSRPMVLCGEDFVNLSERKDLSITKVY